MDEKIENIQKQQRQEQPAQKRHRRVVENLGEIIGEDEVLRAFSKTLRSRRKSDLELTLLSKEEETVGLFDESDEMLWRGIGGIGMSMPSDGDGNGSRPREPSTPPPQESPSTAPIAPPSEAPSVQPTNNGGGDGSDDIPVSDPTGQDDTPSKAPSEDGGEKPITGAPIDEASNPPSPKTLAPTTLEEFSPTTPDGAKEGNNTVILASSLGALGGLLLLACLGVLTCEYKKRKAASAEATATAT